MAGESPTLKFHVRRFDPVNDAAPHIQSFEVPVHQGMTVLDGLHWIRENLDPTLAWRYSCRMGVCGSCGMLINGRPTLACNTQILDVASSAITVAPLPNFEIVRDLAPDLSSLFEKHIAVQPFIVRPDVAELNDPTGEYYQSPHQLEEFLQFTFCIKCGCCMAACPTLATDRRYLGPMPLASAYRYNADSRDDGRQQRAPVVGGAGGVPRCHFAGECSRACPKGVDPARGVQLLKRQLVGGYLGFAGRRSPACKQEPAKEAKRLPNIPDAPPRTVAPGEKPAEDQRSLPPGRPTVRL